MLAVSLGLDFRDLPAIRRKPFSLSIGLASQWIIMPLLTLAFIWLADLSPYISLGLLLVSVCPGGNVSNFFSLLSNGNVALSVALTFFSSIFAVLVTPFGFALFANWSPFTEYVQLFDLRLTDIVPILFAILLLPLGFGFLLRKYVPILANRLKSPMKILGIFILMLFIFGAVWKHRSSFMIILPTVFIPVLLHNLIAFLSGYFAGKVAGLRKREIRTITIETGIQNTGLSLVIIFGFFDGNQEMAAVAAWWGIWHLIAGSALSIFYRYRDKVNSESNEELQL